MWTRILTAALTSPLFGLIYGIVGVVGWWYINYQLVISNTIPLQCDGYGKQLPVVPSVILYMCFEMAAACALAMIGLILGFIYIALYDLVEDCAKRVRAAAKPLKRE